MDRLHTMISRSRYHDVQFAELDNGTEILLVACEDGKTCVYDKIVSEPPTEDDDAEEEKALPELRLFVELIGHSNR